MRRLLTWIVLAPLGLVILLVAIANRTPVTVSLDPFSATAPAYAVTVPLFLVVFIAVVVGVIAGGAATLWGQLRWRRAARRAEREAARLRAEIEIERATANEFVAQAPLDRRIGTG
jgi:uncharacterized integral membrane protein